MLDSTLRDPINTPDGIGALDGIAALDGTEVDERPLSVTRPRA
jgi:hypothetical protein